MQVRKQIWLPEAEYAKIYSEINTNYSKYEGKKTATHTSYGIDNQAWIYYFENRGFDDYFFFAKVKNWR